MTDAQESTRSANGYKHRARARMACGIAHDARPEVGGTMTHRHGLGVAPMAVAPGKDTMKARCPTDTAECTTSEMSHTHDVLRQLTEAAHDINDPLATVIANLDYISESLETASCELAARGVWLRTRLKEPLDDARDAAQRLRLIVRDLTIPHRYLR
jgi:signal transduction histidine kinase